MRFSILLLLLAASAYGATPTYPTSAYVGLHKTTTLLSYQPAPADNPLKGFSQSAPMSVPGSLPNFERFPSSLAGELYFMLSNVMSGPSTFTWTAVESQLEIARTNYASQLILRPCIEYPGLLTGTPGYLITGGLSLTYYADNGGALQPNYADANMQAAILSFIAAFGAQYDGDPRIAFIEIGLLGEWAEWHGPGSAMSLFAQASSAFQTELYQAYTNAFHTTPLLVRYPVGTNYNPSGPYSINGASVPMAVNSIYPGIGEHDDEFNHTQEPTTEQLLGAADVATNKWVTAPNGGEFGHDSSCLWEGGSCTYFNNFTQYIQNVHASFVGAGSSLNENTFASLPTEVALAQMLGYELYVTSWTYWTNHWDGNLAVSVTVTNTGVAPFYYNWPIQLAALTNGHIFQQWSLPGKLSSIVPAAGSQILTVELSNPPPTGFTLLMGVSNPCPQVNWLRFANTTQDKDQMNWLTLGPGPGSAPATFYPTQVTHCELFLSYLDLPQGTNNSWTNKVAPTVAFTNGAASSAIIPNNVRTPVPTGLYLAGSTTPGLTNYASGIQMSNKTDSIFVCVIPYSWNAASGAVLGDNDPNGLGLLSNSAISGFKMNGSTIATGVPLNQQIDIIVQPTGGTTVNGFSNGVQTATSVTAADGVANRQLIGVGWDSYSGPRSFNGYVKFVAIYTNYTVTATDIANLHAYAQNN